MGLIMITIVKGFTVVDGDILSKWIGDTGEIDHNEHREASVRKYVKPGDVIVDVGASFGDNSIPYARAVGPGGAVHAFEPQPESFQCLKANAKEYKQIHCYQQALGESDATMFLSATKGNIGASFLSPSKDELCTEVRIKTLDSFGIKNVRFMKIDTEGFELSVLRGASQTILDGQPTILIEIGDHSNRFGVSKHQVVYYLKSIGYEMLSAEWEKRTGVFDAIAVPHRV